MSETGIQSAHIHERAEQTLRNAHLQEAYRSSSLRLYNHRLEAFSQVPGFERLRDRARALKRDVIEHLDEYLEEFAGNAEKRGSQVHWAATGQEVCDIVLGIARRAGAREVVKGKSMVGEEVELNHALEAAGIRSVETDLGELIIQLAGERPAHIVAPAIHKTREDVSELFVKHLHSEATTEPVRLTAIARQALRQSFARAKMGMSGAN
ncbi:MAG: LUD domain-containing protein, partial [Terriglobia bacterium]